VIINLESFKAYRNIFFWKFYQGDKWKIMLHELFSVFEKLMSDCLIRVMNKIANIAVYGLPNKPEIFAYYCSRSIYSM
jgi:hypothetical protein